MIWKVAYDRLTETSADVHETERDST